MPLYAQDILMFTSAAVFRYLIHAPLPYYALIADDCLSPMPLMLSLMISPFFMI